MGVERGDDFLFLEGWKESIICLAHPTLYLGNSTALLQQPPPPTQIREGLHHWLRIEEYISYYEINRAFHRPSSLQTCEVSSS